MTKKDKKKKKLLQEPAGTKAPPQDERTGKRNILERFTTRKLAVSAILFIVSVSVFIPSYHDGLVWDDALNLKESLPILNVSFLRLEDFVPGLGSADPGHKYFRPVYNASLIIDNIVWDGSWRGFHLSSIIYHGLATVLLYILALMLLGEFGVKRKHTAAFVASFFFAVYPLHVESVSFIAARGDILAAVFFFLCFIFYIRSYERVLYLIPAAICFYLSFLSKEVALAFPIVLIGYDLISGKIKRRVNILKYSVLGLLVVLYFLTRSSSFFGGEPLFNPEYFAHTGTAGRILESAGLFFNAYLFYFLKFIFPYDLNPFIESNPLSGSLSTLIAIIATIGVCFAFVASIRKKEKLSALMILWILATLGPAVMIAIFPMALTRLSERFLYVPSAAYCILLAYLIFVLSDRVKFYWLGWGLSLVLTVSFLSVTLAGQRIWTDNITFWKFAVDKNPSYIAPRINLGDALREGRATDEAIEQYRIAWGPDMSGNLKAKTSAAHSLGVLYIDKGNYTEAEKWFKKAYDINDSYATQYYFHMGYIALRRNDSRSAESYLKKSIEYDGTNRKAYYLLGALYGTMGSMENSEEYYRLAEKYLGKAVSLGSYFPEAHLQLANAYMKTGNVEKALEHARYAYAQARNPQISKQARAIIDYLNSNR